MAHRTPAAETFASRYNHADAHFAIPDDPRFAATVQRRLANDNRILLGSADNGKA
jgi:hypothetical protein